MKEKLEIVLEVVRDLDREVRRKELQELFQQGILKITTFSGTGYYTLDRNLIPKDQIKYLEGETLVGYLKTYSLNRGTMTNLDMDSICRVEKYMTF